MRQGVRKLNDEETPSDCGLRPFLRLLARISVLEVIGYNGGIEQVLECLHIIFLT